MNIIQVILMVISTISLLCLSVCIYLIIKGNSCIFCESSIYNVPIKQKLFLAFAAIGFLMCMFNGAEAMLYWIPNDLGSFDSDDEFMSLKVYLAGAFTFGSMALIGVLESSSKERLELKNCREEKTEVDNFIDAYLSIERLNELKIKYNKIIDEIDIKAEKIGIIDMILDCKSSPKLSRRMIYKSLVEKIDYRISRLDQNIEAY